jgi:hypothetical protein
MSAFGLSFLLDIFTGYVCFGLAFYAGCALVAALWMRRHHTLISKPTLAELLRTFGGMTLLVLLQTLQRLWETSHASHSPSRVLRMVFPLLYLWLGNSVFRAAHHNMGEEFHSKTEPAQTAMKSAQTGSTA